MTTLEKLKILLNQTESTNDSYLQLLLELLMGQCMIYIGRAGKTVPVGLESVVLQMAAEYVRQNQMIGAEGAVKSVSRGDTTISYNTAELSAQAAGDFIRLYRHLLVPFMKVKMR